MTKEEREQKQNMVRVGLNLGVLLDMGLFPGKHSVAIEECKGLVKALVENTKAELSALVPPPAAAPTEPPIMTPPAKSAA